MSTEDLHQTMKDALAKHRAGRFSDAEMLYRQVLSRQPGDANALHMLGLLAGQRGQVDSALDLIGRAISVKPTMAEAHSNLGNFLREKGKMTEAVESYRRAIELKPRFPDAHNNLGVALGGLLQMEDAIAEYRAAIQLRPEYVEAHYNLANALNAQGDLLAAIAEYERAVELRPDYAEAHLNLAIALLLAGDFERGCAEYEWRWKVAALMTPRNFSQPQWNGEELAGKRILLYAEQGFGDAIQFARYIPLVAARGGKVILECQRELQRLFSSVPGVEFIVIAGQPLPEFDVHCPLLSLRLIFGTDLNSIPNDSPYLHADDATAEQWKSRFDATDHRKRVGLVWAGQPLHQRDPLRSITSEKLNSLRDLPNVAFYSLQKGEAAHDPPKDLNLIDWTHDLHDFADTAALIANLDLVLTVDTSVAHLAGALAKPTWIMLPFRPDWRWMRDRADTPWYPTVRLFRQKSLDDWDAVLADVSAELRQL